MDPTMIIMIILVISIAAAAVYYWFFIKKPDVDCVQSTWGDCNPNTKTQSRTVTTKQSGNGKVCGVISKSCIPNIDCVQSAWGVCDPKTKTWSRTVTTNQSGNGKVCGVSEQSCTANIKVVKPGSWEDSALLEGTDRGYQFGEARRIIGLYDIDGKGSPEYYCAYVGDSGNPFLQCRHQTTGEIHKSPTVPAGLGDPASPLLASFLGKDNTDSSNQLKLCYPHEDGLNCTENSEGRWTESFKHTTVPKTE